MSRYVVLAFDFGASSGRGIKAVFENDTLSYQEIHRFENNPVKKGERLYWDFPTLTKEINAGIEKAGEFDSVGFDTWGVDFGLLDENGSLLDNPVHYRDTRTDGAAAKFCAVFGEDALYQETGCQLMNINTLFQLIALGETQPELLKKAKTLLFMPDLFAYGLTGKPACELTIASTSQMLHPQTKTWAGNVLKAAGVPANLLLPVIPSGTVTGTYKNAKVIAVAGHDTQCAVAALPTTAKDVAFLSCGTWSLLGAECDEPILKPESRALELSNEIGANGKINYLKNIIGLWLIQESRRQWKRQGEEYSYAELERLALAAVPFQCLIDPDYPDFGVPGDIPGKIKAYCKKTGQHIPQTVGEIMRCIYQSLALKYRFALEQLQSGAGRRFSALHVLGGGTKDKLLCQMTANSCNIPVVAGPIEATALGNIIIQLVALGAIGSIDDGRKLIANSEALTSYKPLEHSAWNEAYASYRTLLKGGK